MDGKKAPSSSYYDVVMGSVEDGDSHDGDSKNDTVDDFYIKDNNGWNNSFSQSSLSPYSIKDTTTSSLPKVIVIGGSIGG